LWLRGAGDGEFTGAITEVQAVNGTVIHKEDGGTWTFSGTNNYSGSTTVDGGKLIFAGPGVNKANGLTVANGASVDVARNGNRTLVTNSLNLNSTGTLDLKNNKLVDHGDAAVNLQAKVVSGMGTLTNGAPNWNGTGIITSETAAKAPNTTTTLAVASAADVKSLSGADTAVWGGVTVNANDALVMYTYAGDANLSGKIDADDYFQIDSNYNKSGSVSGFFKGDFNYDGQINGDDYFLIDSNSGNPLGQFSTASLPGGVSAGSTSSLQAVPEPASISMLGLAVGGLLRRRRR
jgi:autotransporter-associated beta strand protein